MVRRSAGQATGLTPAQTFDSDRAVTLHCAAHFDTSAWLRRRAASARSGVRGPATSTCSRAWTMPAPRSPNASIPSRQCAGYSRSSPPGTIIRPPPTHTTSCPESSSSRKSTPRSCTYLTPSTTNTTRRNTPGVRCTAPSMRAWARTRPCTRTSAPSRRSATRASVTGPPRARGTASRHSKTLASSVRSTAYTAIRVYAVCRRPRQLAPSPPSAGTARRGNVRQRDLRLRAQAWITVISRPPGLVTISLPVRSSIGGSPWR